jgi:cobalt-zinc-cadmium efflux system membrane fusion protein
MRVVCFALLAITVVTACHRRSDEEDVPHEASTTGDVRPAEAPDALLRIDTEMLRDLRITTAIVEARPAGERVAALGELGVNEDVYAEIGSPVGARVTRVIAAVGDHVTAGQALVELQSAELGKARANALAAQGRVVLARTTLERKRKLAAERVVPQRDAEEAEAAATAAAAELHAANAALDALGISDQPSLAEDASHFRVRSPVAGVVIERDAVVGQHADTEHVLVRVADLDRLWLTVHAFERDAVRVRERTPAEVAFAALPGRRFPGMVTLVGKRVEAASRTVPIRVEVANADGVLRPGMSATAWLPLGEETQSVVAVPVASLQRVRDGWCVFLPRGEGAFEPRAVGRGRDLGGEVEIVSGLQRGETVVVDGAFLLKAEAERARGEGGHHEH